MSDLIKKLKTKKRAWGVINGLEEIKTKAYQLGEIDFTLSEDLKELFPNIEDAKNPDLIKKVLDEVNTIVDSSNNIVKLTLAFEPDKNYEEKLFYWVVENLGENLLLDFELDNSIIGGAIIVYRGKFLDYSAKKKLDNFFAESDLNAITRV